MLVIFINSLFYLFESKLTVLRFYSIINIINNKLAIGVKSMTELSLNNIVKNFGFKNVLNGFDLELNTGERVSLIGPNGSGKTTIFKLIIGEEMPNSGQISIRKGATIGFLSQIPPKYNDDLTVKEIIIQGKSKVLEVEAKLRNLEEKMATAAPRQLEILLKTYGKLQDQYEKIGGYRFEADISKVCNGFKISDEMLKRKFSTLSGGEKTIVSFAKLILSEPSILLLDEPTNHLDINTLEWLEEYLKNYKGSILISSHDRYFLDQVTNKTVLIDRGKSEIFFGNYSYYLEENERRIMAEFEDFKDQQKQIAAMKASIKKLQEFGRLAFPGGEAFFKRAASIQKRLDKLELLDKPEEKKELPLDFQISKRSGKDVLIVENLCAIIGNKVLFDGANMHITFGEKDCLMGKNGSGKSTLVKMILDMSDAELLDGQIKLGSNVLIGYLPQEIHFEDEDITILDMARKFYDGTETHLRASLAKFLFYEDNVFKRVKSLSGGEKVRLKLFELIQKNANFLILDEPTNHIDIDTKEMLEEALKEYNGTLLFISHDRYFINKLAQNTFEINDGKIDKYIGNYDYLKEQKAKKIELSIDKNGKRR